MSGFISYLQRNEVEANRETFISYINDEEETIDEELNKRASNFFQNDLAISLLPGERLVTEADSVLSFTPFTERKQGIAGKLFVTNFKLSFITADKSSYDKQSSKNARQRNHLVADADIPLTSIDAIYQVVSGGRRKKLSPGSTVSNLTKYLEIHCKNFSVQTFGFKFSPKDQNKKVVNAVVHHAYPTKSTLLFAFDYGRNLKEQNFSGSTFLYENASDWERELQKCGCSKWRVTDINNNFNVSISLPKLFVVPYGLLNAEIVKAAAHFVEGRVPTWCYTHKNGSSLVRMASLIPDSDQPDLEQNMLTAVQLADHNHGEPLLYDLEEMCPSIKDVQSSFDKLKELCLIDSKKEFAVQDSSWLSTLDNTRWLQHIAQCLKAAVQVVNIIGHERKSRTVVIKENDSRHFTCVVSSLVQIMLNPDCRTHVGFQCLIQREWVMMGYPFQKNQGLIIQGGGEEIPLFLLFLDCVWQMLLQFPSSFAFSETFLTTLWDTSHIGLFKTFLFDSQYQKTKYASDGRHLKRFNLPTVWDWDQQYSADDQLFFNNPLYLMKCNTDLNKAMKDSKQRIVSSCRKMDRNELYSFQLNYLYEDTDSWDLDNGNEVLIPEYCAPVIKLWSQCYLRWQSPGQIIGGGNPSQYVHQCLLVEEIIHLQHRLENLTSHPRSNSRPHSDLIFSLVPEVSTTENTPKSPSVLEVTCLSSSFPFTPVPTTRDQQFTFIPISAYLENSAIDYDYQSAED